MPIANRNSSSNQGKLDGHFTIFGAVAVRVGTRASRRERERERERERRREAGLALHLWQLKNRKEVPAPQKIKNSKL